MLTTLVGSITILNVPIMLTHRTLGRTNYQHFNSHTYTLTQSCDRTIRCYRNHSPKARKRSGNGLVPKTDLSQGGVADTKLGGTHKPRPGDSERKQRGSTGMGKKQKRNISNGSAILLDIVKEHRGSCLVFGTHTMPSTMGVGDIEEVLDNQAYIYLLNHQAELTKQLEQAYDRLLEKVGLPLNKLIVKEASWDRFIKYGYLAIHYHILFVNKWLKDKGRYAITVEMLEDIWRRCINNIMLPYWIETIGTDQCSIRIQPASVDVKRVKEIGNIKQYLSKVNGLSRYLSKNHKPIKHNGQNLTTEQMFSMFADAGYQCQFDWVTIDGRKPKVNSTNTDSWEQYKRSTRGRIEAYEESHTVQFISRSEQHIEKKLEPLSQILRPIFKVMVEGISYPVCMCTRLTGTINRELGWQAICEALDRPDVPIELAA